MGKMCLVDMLQDNGLSISHHRVIQISAQLGDASGRQFEEDGIMCPLVLRKGLFTTSAMDNISHNMTANTTFLSYKYFCFSTSNFEYGR